MNTKDTDVITMNVRSIDGDLYRRFKALASRQGKSVKELITDLMYSYVEVNKDLR